MNHLSIHQWLRSGIPASQQPSSPIGVLFLKLPPPTCAVLLVKHFELFDLVFQLGLLYMARLYDGVLVSDESWKVCHPTDFVLNPDEDDIHIIFPRCGMKRTRIIFIYLQILTCTFISVDPKQGTIGPSPMNWWRKWWSQYFLFHACLYKCLCCNSLFRMTHTYTDTH